MKKCLIVLAVLIFSVSMFGCGKKQQAMDELQESMTMETMSVMTSGNNAVVAPEANAPETKAEVKTEAVSKPSEIEIQTALKNANFYTGEIDGKIGPKTKKAIEEFQKANNLKADGKVGPKTWALLSTYLNPPVETPEKKKR